MFGLHFIWCHICILWVKFTRFEREIICRNMYFPLPYGNSYWSQQQIQRVSRTVNGSLLFSIYIGCFEGPNSFTWVNLVLVNSHGCFKQLGFETVFDTLNTQNGSLISTHPIQSNIIIPNRWNRSKRKLAKLYLCMATHGNLNFKFYIHARRSCFPNFEQFINGKRILLCYLCRYKYT